MTFIGISKGYIKSLLVRSNNISYTCSQNHKHPSLTKDVNVRIRGPPCVSFWAMGHLVKPILNFAYGVPRWGPLTSLALPQLFGINFMKIHLPSIPMWDFLDVIYVTISFITTFNNIFLGHFHSSFVLQKILNYSSLLEPLNLCDPCPYLLN